MKIPLNNKKKLIVKEKQKKYLYCFINSDALLDWIEFLYLKYRKQAQLYRYRGNYYIFTQTPIGNGLISLYNDQNEGLIKNFGKLITDDAINEIGKHLSKGF